MNPIQYEHAPLQVRCAMLRKHPPVDPVLSILSCFWKPSVGVCQVVSNSPDPGGFVQTSDGGSKRIRLASRLVRLFSYSNEWRIKNQEAAD